VADEAALYDLVAANNEAALAIVKSDGYPQLSNIYYLWDPAERVALITTQADRVKARVLRRDPRAALYVPGSNFYSWAVAEGDAELSEVTTSPGDATAMEILPIYEMIGRADDRDTLFSRSIAWRSACASGGSTAWRSSMRSRDDLLGLHVEGWLARGVELGAVDRDVDAAGVLVVGAALDLLRVRLGKVEVLDALVVPLIVVAHERPFWD
jgi:PPOX class probable F420-dependent enzyme